MPSEIKLNLSWEVGRAAHETIHAIEIEPVCLDGYGAKALLPDLAISDLRSLAIKLMRAMCGLAEQNEAGIADQVEQRI